MRTAVWSLGHRLAAGADEHMILVKPESSVVLKHPVAIDGLYRSLAGNSVELAYVGTALKVATPKGSETISGMDESCPSLPKGAPFERSTSIEIPADALQFVARAMSNEVVRYALHGVLFDGENHEIVASDGKRLHRKPFACPKKFPKIIVGADGVKALMAAQKRQEYAAITKIGVSDAEKDNPEYASIETGRFTMYSRAVQGSFPDYKTVFPKGYHYKIRLDAVAFRAALKDLISFCKRISLQRKQTFLVRFDLGDDGTVNLISGTKEKGHREHRVKVLEFKGAKNGFHHLTIDPTYLYDASWNNEETVIQGNNHSKAVLVDGNAVVMPLTIHDSIDANHSTFIKNADNELKGDGLIPPLKRSEIDRISSWAVRLDAHAGKEDPVKPNKPLPKPKVNRLARRIEEPKEPAPQVTPEPLPSPRERVKEAVQAAQATTTATKPAKSKLSDYRFNLFS
jgi:DNA polymerase III sliding clamp (beta) subunit (PCNA family)